jgi:hypothetical protein
MTAAERLRHRCPDCNAKPGDPCRHYNGEPTTRPHKTRGPGQLDRHLQERIARQTARAKRSYGALFQDLADVEVTAPSVEEVKQRDRFAVARSFDEFGPVGLALCDQANRGLQWLHVHAMFHEIGRRCGDNWYRALRAAVLGGFGNSLDYVPDRMRQIMTTTTPYVLAYFRVPAPGTLLGVKTVPAMTWAPPVPLMTVAEFEARFKMPDHYRGLRAPADDPEPDDGGLFDRMMTALTGAA